MHMISMYILVYTSIALQVNAGECSSWKISLFLDYKEDNPDVLKGVSPYR